MKKQLVALGAALFLALCGSVALAEHQPGQMSGHKSGGAVATAGYADIKKYQACSHCGMDREKFAASRMLITYTDGLSVGVCSIHCAVTELKASKGKTVKSVEVADVNSKKLLAAEKAAWVIGGSRKGVMTQTAKWAFATKADAAAFIKKEGGKPASYKEALALTEKD